MQLGQTRADVGSVPEPCSQTHSRFANITHYLVPVLWGGAGPRREREMGNGEVGGCPCVPCPTPYSLP
jgi:hypothetical protein